MSSPGSRQRRRRQQYQAPRSRRELVVAIGAGVFIVAGTALAIWMLRPGGIADRQPRATWLVALAVGAALVAAYVILRPASRLKADKRVALAGSLGAILVVAIVAGFAWPDGLVRHTPKPFAPPPTAAPPTSASGGTTTSAPGASTTTGAGTTTSGATTTVAPTTTTIP
jgi:hypothetical protein